MSSHVVLGTKTRVLVIGLLGKVPSKVRLTKYSLLSFYCYTSVVLRRFAKENETPLTYVRPGPQRCVGRSHHRRPLSTSEVLFPYVGHGLGDFVYCTRPVPGGPDTTPGLGVYHSGVRPEREGRKSSGRRFKPLFSVIRSGGCGL